MGKNTSQRITQQIIQELNIIRDEAVGNENIQKSTKIINDKISEIRKLSRGVLVAFILSFCAIISTIVYSFKAEKAYKIVYNELLKEIAKPKMTKDIEKLLSVVRTDSLTYVIAYKDSLGNVPTYGQLAESLNDLATKYDAALEALRDNEIPFEIVRTSDSTFTFKYVKVYKTKAALK